MSAREPDDVTPEPMTVWKRDGQVGISCVHGLEVEATTYADARHELRELHGERTSL